MSSRTGTRPSAEAVARADSSVPCAQNGSPSSFGQGGTNHRGTDTPSANLRMYHQLRHAGSIFGPWGEVQVTDDFLAGPVRVRTGDQQVVGTVIANSRRTCSPTGATLSNSACRGDEFAYLPLLVCGQCRPPLGHRHWLCNGSTNGSRW